MDDDGITASDIENFDEETIKKWREKAKEKRERKRKKTQPSHHQKRKRTQRSPSPQPSPPDVNDINESTDSAVAAEEEFDVDQVLDKRIHYSDIEYLIQFSDGTIQWLPLDKLDCDERIAQYEDDNGTTLNAIKWDPKPIRILNSIEIDNKMEYYVEFDDGNKVMLTFTYGPMRKLIKDYNVSTRQNEDDHNESPPLLSAASLDSAQWQPRVVLNRLDASHLAQAAHVSTRQNEDDHNESPPLLSAASLDSAQWQPRVVLDRLDAGSHLAEPIQVQVPQAKSVTVSTNNAPMKEVSFSIKCALGQVINPNIGEETKKALLKQIRETTIKCTGIAAQASGLIHFVFNKIMDEWTNDEITNFFNITDDGTKNSDSMQLIKDFFYGVLEKNVEDPNYPIKKYAPEFLDIMRHHHVEPRTDGFIAQQMKYMYQMYHTNFKNNIVIHTKARLRRFFTHIQNELHPPRNQQQKKDNNSKVYHAIRFLFDGTVEYEQELMNAFTDLLEPNIDNKCGMFMEIRQTWMQHVPLLFRLQRYVCQLQDGNEFGLDRFKIVPLTTFQRRHISIDSRVLFDTLNKIGRVPKNKKGNPFHRDKFLAVKANVTKMWKEYFVIDKILKPIHKKSKWFNNLIYTDGVSVSINGMKKVYDQTEEEKLKQHLAKIKERLESDFYRMLLGLDPGKKLTLGGVQRNIINGEERNLRLKAGTYYRMINHEAREKERRKLDSDLQRRMTADRDTYREISESGPHYVDFANHRFRFFNEQIEVYCSQKYTRLKFDAFFAKEAAMDAIVNNMCQGEPTFAVIGGATMCQGLKGHPETPQTHRFKKYFERRDNCDVLIAPEKRTTMLCSLCRKEMDLPKNQKKARYRTCRKCITKTGPFEAHEAFVIKTNKSKRQLKAERRQRRQAQPQQQQPQQQQQQQQQQEEQHRSNQELRNERRLRRKQLLQNRLDGMQTQQPNNNDPKRLVTKLICIVKNNRVGQNGNNARVVVWNRDVNAGRNILYIGLCMARGEPIDPVFTVARLEDLNN